MQVKDILKIVALKDQNRLLGKLKKILLLLVRSPLKMFRITRMMKNPIIIGGCGRSGTTLLLSVLSCHPHIFPINESWALCPLSGRKQWKKHDPAKPLRVDVLYKHLLKEKISKSCTRVCEKTPPNNLCYGRILDYFGKRVKIINIVRDGRDVVTSVHPKHSKEPFINMREWIIGVEAGLEFENHSQVLTIRYEDLVNHYEKSVRKVLKFIGEEFHESFLCYPKNAKLKTAHEWVNGTASQLYGNSIGRWKDKKYENLIRKLMNNKRAVKLLKHHNYI